MRSFKRRSVPLAVFAVVAATVLVVPPVILGEMTARTYVLTAAVLILAVNYVFPYAVFVALGTLPLLYAGIASFAAPRPAAERPHSFAVFPALRHIVAGLSYVLGAAAVGAIGIGVEMSMENDSTEIPAVLQPSFLYLGGVLVAVTFVSLQLWRYDTPFGGLDRRTILGTVALGILLALSPAVAFWAFHRGF